MLAAVAGALALGLAGCGDESSSDRVGRIPDPNSSFDAKADRPAGTAEKMPGEPGDVAAGKGANAAAVDDSAVTAKVKAALVAEPGLKSLVIDVKTMAGVVTLRGTADSQEHRRKAEQLASNVEGVRSVINEVVVVPS